MPPALEAWNLSQWVTWEFSVHSSGLLSPLAVVTSAALNMGSRLTLIAVTVFLSRGYKELMLLNCGVGEGF